MTMKKYKTINYELEAVHMTHNQFHGTVNHDNPARYKLIYGCGTVKWMNVIDFEFYHEEMEVFNFDDNDSCLDGPCAI